VFAGMPSIYRPTSSTQSGVSGCEQLSAKVRLLTQNGLHRLGGALACEAENASDTVMILRQHINRSMITHAPIVRSAKPAHLFSDECLLSNHRAHLLYLLGRKFIFLLGLTVAKYCTTLIELDVDYPSRTTLVSSLQLSCIPPTEFGVSMRLIAAVSVAITALVILPAGAADAIKVGLTGPFTGGSSSLGISMRDGIKLAVGEINGSGGVLGRQIQLIERDDEAKNEVGAQVSQELINKEQVVATLGFANTGVALAAQRFYQEAEIPVITIIGTGTLITRQFLPPEYPDNYIFRLSVSDNVQAVAIVDEVLTRRGFKAPAILSDSTNYGQLGREDLEKALASKLAKAVAVEKFNIKDTDMTAQLLRAKAAGADVILTYGIGPELAQIANGMAKLGWKVPIVGSWTLAMSSFIDNAGANGEGTMMPQTFIWKANTPRRKAFIESYQTTFKTKRATFPVGAAQGYDAAYLLAAAIRQANSTAGPKIRAALESLETTFEGVVTIYDKPFSAKDHEAITNNMLVFGIIKDGEVVAAREEDVSGDNVVRKKVK
jgi:branched-chain amino acid transport system substrate-binding protein